MKRIQTLCRAVALGAVLVPAAVLFPAAALAGQPLETESTRLLPRGTIEVELGAEHQTSSAGTESALPFAIGYGISNRLELLVEPVPFTSIHDKGLASARGVGDIEATLTGVLFAERAHTPSFAIAGEVKIPTARNVRIGSGKADFTTYLIGSKRFGRWDTHLNLGYTIVGQPAGAQVNNVQSFGVAEEFHANNRFEIVGEVFGSSAALNEGNDAAPTGAESQLTPEIGGAELVGGLGARYHPTGSFIYSIGVTYDNNSAILVHPGLTLKW